MTPDNLQHVDWSSLPQPQDDGAAAHLRGRVAPALALSTRQTMAVRVLIEDARDAQAAAFSQGFGFRPAAKSALALYLPTSDC